MRKKIMKATDINWDGSKVRARPSSIDTFFNCPYQWAKVFLEGVKTIPGARAAIGTAIHKGVEEMWLEAQITQSKEAVNLTMMCDAAIEEFQSLDNEGINYDQGEDYATAESEIIHGTRAFVEDIVPFADIPVGVEEFFTIDLEHPVIEELGGTIDYRSTSTIADVKTSKRKPVPASYTTQQTIYKILAEENGHPVQENVIQAVALTKNPVGYIMALEPKIDRTKFLFNSMLDALEAFSEGVDPKLLFRGNPKYYLCSAKYCSLYCGGCPYVNGDVETNN